MPPQLKYIDMKSLNLEWPVTRVRKNVEVYLLGLILLLAWFAAPKLIGFVDASTGYIDQSIWLLLLLSVISFLMILGLCWWLVQKAWLVIGLPKLADMVLQFKELDLWAQLGYYYACFALLLLAAVGCLAAIL